MPIFVDLKILKKLRSKGKGLFTFFSLFYRIFGHNWTFMKLWSLILSCHANFLDCALHSPQVYTVGENINGAQKMWQKLWCSLIIYFSLLLLVKLFLLIFCYNFFVSFLYLHFYCYLSSKYILALKGDSDNLSFTFCYCI